MVKKISGTPPPKTPTASSGVKGPAGVQRAQSVQGPDAVESKAPVKGAAGVQSVGGVGKSEKGDRSARVRTGTRPLTPAERQYLLELVTEEAEKMFGDGKVSPKKRQLIETSVRMSLGAGSADGDEE